MSMQDICGTDPLPFKEEKKGTDFRYFQGIPKEVIKEKKAEDSSALESKESSKISTECAEEKGTMSEAKRVPKTETGARIEFVLEQKTLAEQNTLTEQKHAYRTKIIYRAKSRREGRAEPCGKGF